MNTTILFPLPAMPSQEQALPVTNSDTEEERELMEKSQDGNREAYAQLFERFSNRIRRMAFLMLHNAAAADDVVQETFAKGLSSIASYRAEGAPHAWFLTIAINICRHQLRSAKLGADYADSDKLDGGRRLWRSRTRGAVTGTIARESARLLSIALGYLTEAQREVFILHYKDDLPYDEIGQILGMRPGAARALAHRAKLTLRDKLGDRFQ